ncbi:MAG TPA: T9SS type B sorting domain-containing protein [Lacibacter sp.]|nr:T9SS type B sorting domain-containing protein [Lacibacter sp.]
MKRFLGIILLTLGCWAQLKAGHISGGEMYYRYIGPGSGTNRIYEVTLRLFRDCSPLGNTGGAGIAELPTTISIGVFINGSNAAYISDIRVNRTSRQDISLSNPNPCVTNPPPVCYQVGYYTTQIELPVNATGYTIAFQSCCRINGLSNGSTSQGATYAANIPGTNVLPSGINNSPVFDVKDTVLVCRNKRFTLPFSASDADGDSLSYSFCDAYASDGITDASLRPPFAPPYSTITYTNSFSGNNPLGSQVSINTTNGLITGIAPSGTVNPNGASYFVVNVCITEWRNGVAISQHRKDFTVRISNCDFAEAELPVDNRTCDGFTYTFNNLTNSNLVRTWSWDFGIPGIDSDTSNLQTPVFTFSDTGVYRIRLIVNRGDICTDTSFSTIYVFPGFTPDFQYYDGCRNVPIQFRDATYSVYGSPNYWHWDFGVPNVINDTSRLRNPQFSFPQNGSYFVKLIAGSSKGCIDTVSHVVNITDKPALQLTNDTLICSIDTLQLNANGVGSFSWSPAYNISNTNVSNPLVSPDVRTKYYVTLTLAPGCFNTDSVIIDVKDFVTLLPFTDTTICRGDPVTFRPVSDGLYYSWSPPNLFADARTKNATAIPTQASTTFTLTSSIGKCTSTTNVTVRTVPYPLVNAGPDVSICFRDTALLTGSGDASSWLWSPARLLNFPTRTITDAFPLTSTNFVLRGLDTLGCPKPSYDTVLVTVIPQVQAFAGNDTAVVVGQPLQLLGRGAAFYEWSPPTYLNAPNIVNPVAVFNSSVERFSYIMKATTPEGCFGLDTVNIRIFKTAPDIFVPTAFTPDANNLNDVFRPIAVGISKFDYFRVFNRWGNLLYTSPTVKDGWDGTYKGIPQAPDTYVWMVSGTDYTGKKVVKKGTVQLIR